MRKELSIAVDELILRPHDKIWFIPVLLSDCVVPDITIGFGQTLKSLHWLEIYKDWDGGIIKIVSVIQPDKQYKEIEEIVKKAIEVEFDSYKKLPNIETENLRKYFNENGSAYKRIYNLLIQHKKREWVISNSENPSTIELLDIKARKISSDEYTVITKERWYLRWYSINEEKYRLIYDETNDQNYNVIKIGDIYKVNSNIYPQPNKTILKNFEYKLRKIFKIP